MSVRILITGQVQAVGFRFFCKGLAKKLNIKGTAQNLESGEVEIFASGEEENLSKFLSEIKQGNFLSDIKKMQVEKIDLKTKFEGFTVLR